METIDWRSTALCFALVVLSLGCRRESDQPFKEARVSGRPISTDWSESEVPSRSCLSPSFSPSAQAKKPHVVPSEPKPQVGQPVALKRDGHHPNILLVFTDDQSWRTVGCYAGRPWARTPNIDRLAAEGIRFTHAYGAPSCTVSRALLLTGLHAHGIQTLELGTDNERYNPEVCRFWPSVLRQSGYTTSIIGKWHLGPDTGHGRDWDHSLLWRQMPGALRITSKRDWYFNPRLSLDGGSEKSIQGYSTDLYTQSAVEFVRREHERPWFLFLAYNAPHGPILPHTRHQQRYADAPVYHPDGPKPAGKSTSDYQEKVRNYHRLVCAIDEGIGQIRAALEETGQLDNTVIVFTSDQGYSFGEHGVTGKLAYYDANVRIPLIVRYPREVSVNSICRHPVGLIDLPPTLLSFAGVPLPWKMHGHDLRPILEDPKMAWHHPVLLENFYLHYGTDTDVGKTSGATLFGIPWWISLTQGRYKYVRLLLDDTVEELYDLEADPAEQTNLAMDEEHKSLLADYRNRAVSELRRTDAGLVDNMSQPRVLHSEQ